MIGASVPGLLHLEYRLHSSSESWVGEERPSPLYHACLEESFCNIVLERMRNNSNLTILGKTVSSDWKLGKNNPLTSWLHHAQGRPSII